MWHHFLIINENNESLPEKEIVLRASCELAFISSTRGDESGGLRSALMRGELIEFLLRAATAWVEKAYSQKEKVSTHL